MPRTRYSVTCAVCNKEFLATRRTAKCCSKLCIRQNNPDYRRNTELSELADLYISLGFTAEQVYDDYIRDYHKIDSFARMLERRKMHKLARRFRAVDPRPDGRRTMKRADAAQAA
jgi:hypothetical protein